MNIKGLLQEIKSHNIDVSQYNKVEEYKDVLTLTDVNKVLRQIGIRELIKDRGREYSLTTDQVNELDKEINAIWKWAETKFPKK